MRQTSFLRSFLSLVISATVMLAVVAPGTAGAASGFGDVENDEYYTEAVAWMVGEGITTGIEAGCFGPSQNVTRGQVATFLYRLDASRGNEPVDTGHPFVDVVATYQQAPVGWLFGEALTTGVTPVTFAPNRSITRGDFAVLLWRYAGSPAPESASPFVDLARDYQRAAVAWLAEQSITTGTGPTTFDPEGIVSRAQAATFLFRFVDPTDVEPIEESPLCTRELRLALETGGLTTSEAMCAVPWLTDFEIDYLLAVVEDRATASLQLIFAAATVGAECLTPDRVADLSRLFL